MTAAVVPCFPPGKRGERPGHLINPLNRTQKMKTRLTFILSLAAALCSSAFTPLIAATYDRHDKHPVAISNPAPNYPLELRMAEIEGAVLVSYSITAQGRVLDPVVVKSTDRRFEASVLKAVKKWRFTPAVIEGRTAGVPAIQLIEFKLQERNTPTVALVEKLKSRMPVKEKIASTSLCFCDSGKEFNDCHQDSVVAAR
jgi:TonB family protein